MENEHEDNVTQDADGGGSRKKYPVRDLKGMLEFVTKIYMELGPSQYHSREDIAKLHSLEVTSIKQIMSTAVQYGLLELKHGTGYKVSSLFVKIHKPLNENEKQASVVESLQQSEVMKKLLDDYVGHTLPAQSGITNNIARTWEFKDAISSRVAEIFLKNVNDFNLVNGRGELLLKRPTEKPADPPPIVQQKNTEHPKPPSDGSIEIPVPLKNGRLAHIRLPNDYTDTDLRRISKFVDALKDGDNDGETK
jgi:hypothetical protein